MLSKHISEIKSLTYGMDVIIISVTSIHEGNFWKKRLDRMRGQVIKREALIFTVFEDWDKGAGNALGTLYAFQKALEEAQTKYEIDLIKLMDEGNSIALYHTAGKGTRLAPMTGCEYNSKSRIKLIGRLFDKNGITPITLLEAVIKQTSILAPYRKGRLSVFWGDQLFIPSIALEKTPHEIDLLVKPINQAPSENEWEKNGYDKYGFVIVNEQKNIKQLEKLSYQDFSNLFLEKNESLAFSLGSFSLSKNILNAFLKEFSRELFNKNTSLDTDPHLWMPLSLSETFYLNIMKKKGGSQDFIKNHFSRMQKFKERFQNEHKPLSFLGASSMGEKAYWWDYGNRQSYFESSLKLVENTTEAKALRQFFSVEENLEKSSEIGNLKIENSVLINCSIQSGVIKNSVLINVVASTVSSEKSVILNSSAQKIEAKEAILYNVLENGPVNIQSNKIRADNFSKENGHIKLYHKIYSDLPWDLPVEGNPLSFEELHQKNQKVNPDQGQIIAMMQHNKIRQALFDLQN